MKLRNKNKFKTATAILSILCVIMLAVVLEGKETGKELGYKDSKTPQQLCEDITGTPAWVTSDGSQLIVFSYGYKGATHPDGGNLVDFLIENEVYMLYSPGCGWCEKQIEAFGNDCGRYNKLGYAIDCSK